MPQHKKAAPVRRLDGHVRSEAREAEINDLCAALFTTPSGAAVMNYLRSVTIETVAGPEVTTDHLRHLEGQRYIVGLLSQRVQAGVKARSSVSKENTDAPE